MRTRNTKSQKLINTKTWDDHIKMLNALEEKRQKKELQENIIFNDVKENNELPSKS